MKRMMCIDRLGLNRIHIRLYYSVMVHMYCKLFRFLFVYMFVNQTVLFMLMNNKYLLLM